MKNDRPLVIAARHGKTAFNASGTGDGGQKIRGWLDIPLNEAGKKDAEELANKVVDYPVEEIFCSDLRRAEQTSEPLSEALGLPVQYTRRLRPWNLGWLTGQPVKDVMPIMNKFVENQDQTVPGGESFTRFRVRCLSFIKQLCQKAQADQKTICIVAHTRNLQLIKAWLAKGAPDDFSIDKKTMEDYSDEILPGGFLEIEPGEVLGPEYDHGSSKTDPDANEP